MDTLLPFVNAHLQKVQAKGTSERYDRAATLGAVKWQSTPGVDTPAYVFETQATAVGGERLDQPVASSDSSSIAASPVMTVEASLGIDWEREDSVTFDHLKLDTSGNVIGSVSATRRIKDVNQYEVVGLVELIFWGVP